MTDTSWTDLWNGGIMNPLPNGPADKTPYSVRLRGVSFVAANAVRAIRKWRAVAW